MFWTRQCVFHLYDVKLWDSDSVSSICNRARNIVLIKAYNSTNSKACTTYVIYCHNLLSLFNWETIWNRFIMSPEWRYWLRFTKYLPTIYPISLFSNVYKVACIQVIWKQEKGLALRGVGTGGPGSPKFTKVPFFREQSALYLREKCRSDCIFCPMAFDLWLNLFLYFGMSWKILLFSGKIIICPEKFWHLRKKILRWPPPLPPVANISVKKILGALFIRKVPFEAWPPPPPNF